MAGELGRLETDQLFLGLTRPAVIIGVTYSWFTIEALFWSLYFINTSDFGTLIPGAFGTHALGFLICNKEPRFMDIWMCRISQCTKCRNRRIHGNTNSYDLYKEAVFKQK